MKDSHHDVALTFRRMFFGFAAATCLAISVELVLLEHVKGWEQRIPFALSILIWVAAALGLRPRSAVSIHGVRVLAIVVLIGVLFGTYQHFTGNFEFVTEIYPELTRTEALLKAMKGASPLLAPGALALASFLCLAATHRHPLIAE